MRQRSKGERIIENVVVFTNPNSANQKDSEEFIDKLNKLQNKNEFNLYVQNNPVNDETFNHIFKKFVPKKTLIGPCGGDGTVHDVVNKYLEYKYNESNKDEIDPILTIISAGGSNDTASQLHPVPWARKSPQKHLDSPAPYYRPLMIEISKGDYSKKIAAVSYFSIGLTSLLAKDYNSEEFRSSVANKNPKLKRLYQGLEIPKYLHKSQPFILEDQFGPRVLYDLIFPNGSRMAGGAIQFSSTDLLKKEYGRLEVKSLTVPSVIKNMGKSVLGIYQQYGPDDKQEFIVKSLDESPIIIQADGEDYSIPSGSKVIINLGKVGLRLVSTRLFIPSEQLAKAA